MKWLNKLAYRQLPGKEIAFPQRQWVFVALHLLLSEDDTGRMELWQNGMKVLNLYGQTMPLANTVYNSLEIGISATSKATIVHMDDLFISKDPFINPPKGMRTP